MHWTMVCCVLDLGDHGFMSLEESIGNLEMELIRVAVGRGRGCSCRSGTSLLTLRQYFFISKSVHFAVWKMIQRVSFIIEQPEHFSKP